jgi:predicted MFS family arabinose efflux permease
VQTQPIPAATTKSLLWLALGTFAIGTEGFMIAPMLPVIAQDLRVRVTTAGQLVTAFALSYAISSPFLTTLTGALNRRRLLITALACFAVANIFAAVSHGFWGLLVARIGLATMAGLYVPSANALATALVQPERRGTALGIVNGGLTIAIALGVPLGALLGHTAGWRTTFFCVAALAAAVTAALVIALPKTLGAQIPMTTLAQRVNVLRTPGVLGALGATTFWALGAYTIYTYLAVYLGATLGISGGSISLVLFLWGASAALGVFIGGTLTDRVGHTRVIVPALCVLVIAFCSLSLSAFLLGRTTAFAPVLISIVIWGVSAWAFFPAQQTRLVSIAGLSLAPIALSLNASFMYFGFSGGAVLGGFVLSRGAPTNLGWVSALGEIVALILILYARHQAPPRLALVTTV